MMTSVILFTLLALMLLIVLSWFGIRLLRVMKEEAMGTDLMKETVPLARLPVGLEGLRILFISDIHRRRIDPGLSRQVEEQGGAELVLIGGDVRESGVSLELVRENMRLLSRLGPTYAVFGNHDYDEDIEALRSCLEDAEVKILQNRYQMIRLPGREPFKLAGTDDPRTLRDRLEETLTRPLAPEPDQSLMQLRRGSSEPPFTVLMTHDPILAYRSRQSGIAADLVLSGHTHGGQIVLPLFGPAMRTASVRKFRVGWFQLPAPVAWQKTGPHKVRLLVSPGYGTSKAPIRLNCPPAVHLLILTKGDK
ncbi:Predicted phosphohydrolase, MPP superfamily [Paenibacillaceae bacterium GAS479]|nr:Predicted phosphohydrolase, MPP superfamily [Paenibacillaceae bacterium GAS479]